MGRRLGGLVFLIVTGLVAFGVVGPGLLPRLRVREPFPAASSSLVTLAPAGVASPAPAASAPVHDAGSDEGVTGDAAVSGTSATVRGAGGDPDPERFDTVATERATLGTDGGALALPDDHGRLELPPGALAKRTTIGAALMIDDAGHRAIDLTPDGLTFKEPVTLALALPAGHLGAESEIAVYDPDSQAWVAEADQRYDAATHALVARIAHFSLRRIRVRPGMNFPFDPQRARGSFFLESDPTNSFEKLVDGRWQTVNRKTPAFRELVKLGRLGRHDLIASGRLRAVVGPSGDGEALSDDLRAVLLPPDAPAARTGWVRLVRLDEKGRETPFATIARVVSSSAAADATASTIPLSRAAMEALGLAWGRDFGADPADPDQRWVRVRTGNGRETLPYVPLRVEPWSPREGPPA